MDGIDTRTAADIDVAIYRTGQGGTYGERMSLSHPDLRWEVREAIEEEIFRGRESGELTVGGQAYRWWIAA